MHKKLLSIIIISFVLLIPFISATTILKGIVIDKDNALVANANLQFDCSPAIANPPLKTDDFGSFRIETIAAQCEISAKESGFVGSTIIAVEENKINKAIITLNTPIRKNNSTAAVVISIVILFAVLFFLFWLLKKTKDKNKTNNNQQQEKIHDKKIIEFHKPKEEKQTIASSRLQTIAQTVTRNEKIIIDYLLQNNNKAVQSSLRHATGITRTTLTRTLQSLEQKKVLTIEKHGKAVKINFTPWILEKE